MLIQFTVMMFAYTCARTRTHKTHIRTHKEQLDRLFLNCVVCFQNLSVCICPRARAHKRKKKREIIRLSTC